MTSDARQSAGGSGPLAFPLRSVEDLVAACSRANLAQAESMARQFVATHPADERAWHVLAGFVEQGGDFREAGRLAAQGLERFASSRRLRLVLARALVQSGRVGEAASLLRSDAPSDEESLLLADIELARDPGHAGDLYAALSRRFPGNPFLDLGRRAAASARRTPGATPKVVFLLMADWHAMLQLPIADALESRGIAFACTTNPWMLAAHRPRVVVMSAPTPPLMRELRLMAPGARFVNTRHGISVNGKNYGLYSAAACDHVCASSERQAEQLRSLALLPEERVWPTGYPQMDELFRRLRDPAAQGRGSHSRRVLFAPTFNRELSAAFLVGEDPVSALRGDDPSIAVVLTAHPQLRLDAPRLLAAWRELSRRLPNVEYFDSATCNVSTRLADVDVLVSDVSSVATQFVALDRPLVRLVDASRASASGAYAPGATEWQLESVATTVTRVGDLAAAVREALSGAQPEAIAANRRRLREELFGTLTDGRAGERIAERLAQLLALTERQRPGERTE